MPYLLFAILLIVPLASQAATYQYDFGPDQSGLMEGFTRVTDKDAYTAEKGYGWTATGNMKPHVQVFKDPVPNPSRGTVDPPRMYTNALTEDCLVGDAARTFQADVPAGEWRLYVLCGISYGMPAQYFDFDVAVGGKKTRVQFEGSYQFRNLRLSATTDGKPLQITLDPRSKWALNAIMVWNAAEDEKVAGFLKPLEEQMYGLPPAEMAKWEKDPPPPTASWDPRAVTRTDLFRGFVIYHKPYLECVYPTTNPYGFERRPEIRVFATPGEYEPLTFEVRTLSALTGVRVTAGDIGPIKANTVDVRHVRYMRARPNYTTMYRYRIVPDVLERFDALTLPANESHRFWLTAQVPEDAKPGIYEGSIEFTAEAVPGQPNKVTVPVTLRVLDIKLKEDPSKIYGIYYRHPLDQWVNATDQVSKDYFWHKAELEHADMVAHGTRNVVMSASCGAADAEGKFTANWTALSAKIEMARKYNFTPPFVVSISTGSVYYKYMKESFGGHLRGLKMPPPEFFTEMRDMAAFVESERKKNGWPEFLYYPIDEPGQSAEAVKFMTELLKAVQSAGVRTYVTADPTAEAFQPMKPYVDVWCTQPFAPDRETLLADTAARKVEYWCYPNHVNGENDHTPVAGARMTYGFGFWRSGFRTLIPWIYQSSTGDPFNYLDGSSMDFFNRSEPDGTPMPVAMWEAYREGYDDYRYVYTLQTLIDKARAQGKQAEADAAEKELRSVWDAIRVQEKYKYDDLWAPEEFDVYRWVVARAILKLHDAGVRE
jgi:hypothetical protein